MNKFLKTIIWVFTALIFLLAFLVMLLGIVSIKKGKIMKIFGYSYSVVVSGSMEPEIEVGDIIFFKDYNYEELEVDDIIIFYNPEEEKNICHRVKEITEEGIITKGDNNMFEDSFIVKEEDLIGKITKHGRCLGIGTVVTDGRIVLILVVIAAFAYLIVSEIFSIYSVIQKKKILEMKEKKNKDALDQIDLKKMEEEIKAKLLEEFTNKE